MQRILQISHATDPPDDISYMSSQSIEGWPVEICRDRVRRAGEIRNEIGREWERYLSERPRQLGAIRETATTWVFVVKTVVPTPIRLSTLFGEWLYELRAALDGIAYHLAVVDSGQDPPPAQRQIYFPIMTDPKKFDSRDHRNRLIAISDQTFALLRSVQPFNAVPDHRSNVLWWVDELARIDRHRRGHALAPHIRKVRLGFRPPLTPGSFRLPDPARSMPIDESSPMPIAEFEAPAGWNETQVRACIDYSEAFENTLDVTEWAEKSTRPMRSFDLSQRMGLCERQVLEGIINPLATGDAAAAAGSGNGG